MRLRRLAYCTLALGLVSTTTTALAAAKAKPACNLILDKAGDARAAVVLTSDGLDILSGDIATGKKTLVGTLRLKKTAVNGDTAALMGTRWDLRFTLQGSTYILWRRVSAAPNYTESFGMTINGVEVADAKLKPKAAASATAITWTVPRAAFAGLKKPKGKFSEIGATTYSSSTNADAADSTATYQDMASSCLKAS